MSETISVEAPAEKETRNHVGWRTSLCMAESRQSCFYVMRTSRKQKHKILLMYLCFYEDKSLTWLPGIKERGWASPFECNGCILA